MITRHCYSAQPQVLRSRVHPLQARVEGDKPRRDYERIIAYGATGPGVSAELCRWAARPAHAGPPARRAYRSSDGYGRYTFASKGSGFESP